MMLSYYRSVRDLLRFSVARFSLTVTGDSEISSLSMEFSFASSDIFSMPVCCCLRVIWRATVCLSYICMSEANVLVALCSSSEDLSIKLMSAASYLQLATERDTLERESFAASLTADTYRITQEYLELK